jgi:hypothetical protein
VDNVRCDRTNNGDYDSRLKSLHNSAQLNLALYPGLLPFFAIQSIDRSSTQVDQIAVEAPKRFQEIGVSESRKCGDKCTSDGTIKT